MVIKIAFYHRYLLISYNLQLYLQIVYHIEISLVANILSQLKIIILYISRFIDIHKSFFLTLGLYKTTAYYISLIGYYGRTKRQGIGFIVIVFQGKSLQAYIIGLDTQEHDVQVKGIDTNFLKAIQIMKVLKAGSIYIYIFIKNSSLIILLIFLTI